MSNRGVEPNAIGSMVPPFGGGASGGGGGGGSTRGASPLQWNANTALVGVPAQAGSFNGLLVADALLAGPGPFDGQRIMETPETITALWASQRVPSDVAENTQVEFYRLRAGVVTSLGVVTLTNVSQFQVGTTAPAAAALQAGDILFVSMAATITGVRAADLSCYIELT